MTLSLQGKLSRKAGQLYCDIRAWITPRETTDNSLMHSCRPDFDLVWSGFFPSETVYILPDTEDVSEALTSPCLLFITAVPEICAWVFIRKGSWGTAVNLWFTARPLSPLMIGRQGCLWRNRCCRVNRCEAMPLKALGLFIPLHKCSFPILSSHIHNYYA